MGYEGWGALQGLEQSTHRFLYMLYGDKGIRGKSKGNFEGI